MKEIGTWLKVGSNAWLGAGVCMVVLVTGGAMGATFNVPSGDWSGEGSWTPSEPVAGEASYITGGRTCIVTEAGEACGALRIGNYDTATTTLDIVSGDVAIGAGVVGWSSPSIVSQSGGTSTWTPLTVGYTYNPSLGQSSLGIYAQTGGRVACSGDLNIALAANSTGTYSIANGELETGGLYVGKDGEGTFEQISGQVEITGAGGLQVGYNNGATGTYTLSGGTTDVQYAGSYLWIGRYANSRGVFNFTGGELRLTNGAHRVYVGADGYGELNFGDATGSGTWVDNGGGHGLGTLMYIRSGSGGEGVFRGWGTVGLTSYLRNSGRIIADGYGQERTLDFSSMSRLYNDIENTSSNGYYAVNGGKLILTSYDKGFSGDSTNYWGDANAGSGDPVNDLVNSVNIVYEDGSGTLSGALLATDRSDIPTMSDRLHSIGVWQFTGVTVGGATLYIRYDDTAVSTLQCPESELRVFHYRDGAWKDVSGGINTTEKRIATTKVSELGLFAVGHEIRGTRILVR